MSLINCEIKLLLNCSAKCFLVTVTAANYVSPFTITDTNFYIPAVFLSTQGNVILIKKPELDFRRPINWNKDQFK